MSKGLGKIEKMILKTLELSKNSNVFFVGKGYSYDDNTRHSFSMHGYEVVLREGWYDLRKNLKYLAIQLNQTYCNDAYVNGKFQSTYSRAVKRLIQKNYLEKSSLIPISKVIRYPSNHIENHIIHNLSDGLFIFSNRQNRIVKLVKNFTQNST